MFLQKKLVFLCLVPSLCDFHFVFIFRTSLNKRQQYFSAPQPITPLSNYFNFGTWSFSMFTISKSTRWIQPRHTINNSRKAKTEIELRFQFVLQTFSHGLRRDLQGGDVVSRVSGSLLPSSKQGLTALLQCCNVGAKPRTDATGLGWSTPCSSTKHMDAGGTKFLPNAPDYF
jgi:hypothetical protein